MAVYVMAGEAVIVAGVYGKPEGDDHSSTALFEELELAIQELQHLYGARHIILAGDFNATRNNTDASSGNINKPRATQKLNSLIEQLQLRDLDQVVMQPDLPRHTWHRPNDPTCSSRLDYIFTNMTLLNP